LLLQLFVQLVIDSRKMGHCSSVKMSFGGLVCCKLLTPVIAVAAVFERKANDARTKNRDMWKVIVNSYFFSISIGLFVGWV
jgi:hypothetical protein